MQIEQSAHRHTVMSPGKYRSWVNTFSGAVLIRVHDTTLWEHGTKKNMVIVGIKYWETTMGIACVFKTMESLTRFQVISEVSMYIQYLKVKKSLETRTCFP